MHTSQYILGLNAYHADSAACIVHQGRVLAAAEEERFNRIKHWSGLPVQAIAECLALAGIGAGQIGMVAINRNPRAALPWKLWHALRHAVTPALAWQRLTNARAWDGIGRGLATALPALAGVPVRHVEHHRAHMAGAYFPSPFDRALVVSVDGFGDFASAAWGIGNGTVLDVRGRIRFPHSLGIFYQALTQYLGFWGYGDEYKVMGLAAWGKPDQGLREQIGRMVKTVTGDGAYRLDLGYFRHHRENVAYRWCDTAPSAGMLYGPALERSLGPARAADAPLEQRHADIALATQLVFEERLFALLGRLRQQSGVDDLALSGGCAQNSLANGRLAARAGFARVWVPPAATDAGGAIGAALDVWIDGGGRRVTAGETAAAFLGPAPQPAETAAAMAAAADDLAAAGAVIVREDDRQALARRAAGLIAGGGVVGLCDGAMEFGPRALGARSILADPRGTDTREILNRKIKRRENFRPFAPAVLAEQADEWFAPSHPDALDSPFMAKVVPVRHDRREMIAAVTHADGTARLQTVGSDHPTLLRPIIAAFFEQTGVPMVINTSFNENEPIVATVAQALACFLRTGMDALVVPPFLVERRQEK